MFYIFIKNKNMKKKCNKCLIEKTLLEFNKDNTHSDGHSSICKVCKKSYLKKYQAQNKKKIKNYYKDNRQLILDKKKKFYENNKEEITKKTKIYRKENKDKIRLAQKTLMSKLKSKKRRQVYEKNKRTTNKLYHLTCNIRGLIRNSFVYKGISKKCKTAEILGCNFQEFKNYIESKFESWMNWDNYGKYNGNPNYGWDLDHIIPLCVAKNIEELLKLNHHTNFQPLCSKINRNIKRGKF
jgi:hypothetical protein